MVDQVFFVGDGRTNTGAGEVQKFCIPDRATTLVLGIVDANSYSGAPGAYFDNSCELKVALSISGAGTDCCKVSR